MALVDLDQIEAFLQNDLSPSRFAHSKAVSQLAKRLAKRHLVDPILAERVGLVHDCAKEWSPSRLIRYARRHRLKIPDFNFIKRNSPNILHAYVGANEAFRRCWVDGPSARSIAVHTLGDFKMSVLDKIIYIADFAATDRRYKQAKAVRKLAIDHLDDAFRRALKTKIKFSLKHFRPVHPHSLYVWNSYV